MDAADLLTSWELAEIEECRGDSLFFGGESGGAVHYRAAMRALVPQGATFSSSEENDRRMQAYNRLTNKLYAVGPDGKSRPHHDAQPHPRFKPAVCPAEAAPKPPAKSIAERREAALLARRTRERRETQLGQLLHGSSHQDHYALGELWFAAAKALAPNYSNDALDACKWSRHFFELYNQAWNEHLPASRWDSDGGQEMQEIQTFENSLGMGHPAPELPDWVCRLIDGNWERALTGYARTPAAPAPEFKPFAEILADACRTAGKPFPELL